MRQRSRIRHFFDHLERFIDTGRRRFLERRRFNVSISRLWELSLSQSCLSQVRRLSPSNSRHSDLYSTFPFGRFIYNNALGRFSSPGALYYKNLFLFSILFLILVIALIKPNFMWIISPIVTKCAFFICYIQSGIKGHWDRCRRLEMIWMEVQN